VAWSEWAEEEIDSIRAVHRWRELRPLDGGGPGFRLGDGSEVVSFASNDYLGLSQHPKVKSAAREAIERWGTGAGASRLIVGDRPVHHDLEDALADWRGMDAALVTPSGYQANLAAIATFGAGSRIVSDELNHASIIDAARLARAEVAVYDHGDVEQAARLVEDAPGRALVVTDTVFSMDGDVAPIEELSEMAIRHDALLILDDAHMVLDAEPVNVEAECLRVGTLSKALGAQGGYITGPRRFVDLLVNRARAFIFTTALAPSSSAAALAAISVCRSPEGDQLRAALRGNVDAVKAEHPSPIIPIVVGEEAAAVSASTALLEMGLLVPAIRPPTVPVGTSRLRIAISAAHSPGQISRLVEALSDL
jgi:8-amino-7-oxononanoate synthase